MNVLQLCDSDVASVRVEVSAADAIRLMLDRHVGKARREIGMIAKRDYDAVLDHEQAIRMVPDRRIAQLRRILRDAQ